MEFFKRIGITISILFLVLNLWAQMPEGYPNTNREKQNINIGWKFIKNNNAEKPADIDFNASTVEMVCLPQNPDPISLEIDNVDEDWVQSKFMRDISWYSKELIITKTANEKVFIEFEGVHTVTDLWINDHWVGKHDVGGYIPFHMDITAFVKSGKKHRIVVKANNSMDSTIAPDPHRTDYVKFGGIYRDMYLVKTNKLHVGFNWESFDAGVHITTPLVKKRNATISVKTTVKNEYENIQNCHIVTKIIDADGLVIQTMESKADILANGTYTFRQTTAITNNLHLWSPAKPYLYRAVSYIYKGTELVDFTDNKFGMRWFELVDGQGFKLNGEPFFMLGVNRHQSFPHIGDAVPNSMHYQEVLRYKEAGINTIRLSHYPQDDAFIEACDELGILLYEEPATWIDWERGIWMDKLEQSLRVTIRNHRNSPSIIIWGAGINHRGPVPALHLAAKEEDPYRLTASASSAWNGIKNSGLTDIYATMDYRESDWPEGDFCMVMEHGCSANSETNQYHISRYKKRKNNIGALAWLGADYNHLQPKWKKRDKYTEYAILTPYRQKRPVYYWYKSELIDAPMVHIADESVSRNGKIKVFSNASKVALYANGKLVAIQSPDNRLETINIEHPSFTFYFNWKNETLKAVALNRGEEIATFIRKKVGEPYALKLELDYPEMALIAGGSDMKILRAFVVDKQGEVITDANCNVHFDISGQVELVYNKKEYIKQVQTYNGSATVYLKGLAQAGEIKVKASSANIKPATITFTSLENNKNEIENKALAIFDFPTYRVDIGSNKQLVQFNWTNWNLTNSTDSKLLTSGDVEFELISDTVIQYTNGNPTMMGNLPFLCADGAYVPDTSLTLTIKGLQKGTYMLETFHHARIHKDQFPYKIDMQIQGAQEQFYTSSDHIVDFYNNDDTGERSGISVKNKIEVNNEHPVKVSFKTNKNETYTWLNGFILRQVK